MQFWQGWNIINQDYLPFTCRFAGPLVFPGESIDQDIRASNRVNFCQVRPV